MFGEIGLAGEVRPAPRGQERLREAAKLGFERAIVPKANLPKAKIAGLETARGRAHRPGGAALALALILDQRSIAGRLTQALNTHAGT